MVVPNEPHVSVGGRSLLEEAGLVTCISSYNVVEEKLYLFWAQVLKKPWQLLPVYLEGKYLQCMKLDYTGTVILKRSLT